MTGKDVFREMGGLVKRRDFPEIRKFRKEISRNMDERGMFYDEELGWIRHDRVQDALDKNLITYCDERDSYSHSSVEFSFKDRDKETRRSVTKTGVRLAHNYTLSSVEEYLRGGLLVEHKFKFIEDDDLGL